MLYLTNAQVPQSMGILSSLFPLILMGVVFYFLILKPQRKQQEKQKETQESLKLGSHVIVRSGIRGVVVQLKGDSFILETGNNGTQIEFLRESVAYIEEQSNLENPNVSEFNNEPIGDLSYGNDVRFINMINEAKNSIGSEKEYDILLEDIYEFIVVENTTRAEDIVRTYKLPENRAHEILEQLTELKLLEKDFDNYIIKVDPR